MMELNPSIKFIPSAVKVSEVQVAKFETEIGFKLPADYREFLKTYNGPAMEPKDSTIDDTDFSLMTDLRNLPDLTRGDSKLDFFGVSRWTGFADPIADYRYGIIEQYEITSNDWALPKSVIPIGGNSGPAKIYLNLSSNAGFGQVLLVGDTLVERQSDELEIRVEDFVVAAPSFRDFVAALKWIRVDD